MFIYSKLRVIRPNMEIKFKLTLTGIPSQRDILSCNYELMNETSLYKIAVIQFIHVYRATNMKTGNSSDEVE